MNVQLEAEPPFMRLGEALAAARIAAGLETQSDVARRLRVTQQTVSRWEAGLLRPRANQLSGIAVLLHLKTADLMRLAKYEGPPVHSFVEPFPVDRLDPETFEVFTAYLVGHMHPGAKVRRAGKTGHKQNGIDVEAALPDGSKMVLQCKRMIRFGPAEARAAIAACAVAADEKIIVISRVASPQVAEAIHASPGWTLWDKDDLSRLIRERLAPEAQDRLVDLFFRGQRQSLLGRSEPGPWLTIDEFFLPFGDTNAPLSHGWRLLGRSTERQALLDALGGPLAPFLLLSGPGGMGKSRLLKEAIARFHQQQPGTLVRILSGASETHRQSLEALGVGSKLLVVDDAHDRDGLGVLFGFAADPSHQTRVLLATRPYAEARIRREAAVHGLAEPVTVQLDPLGRADLQAFAADVLQAFGGSEDWAESLVRVADGSPLIVALAGRVIAKERIPFELAKNRPSMRDLVLGKFAKVITGELGIRGDERLHRDALDVLALVQPFHPEDPQLLGFFTAAKGIGSDDAARALRNLVEGGVAYRRGHQCRLTPDVLGDYIIETSCLDVGGNLSSFALRAVEVVPAALLANILINLGRLDWRRNNGDTGKSRLLEKIWQMLDGIKSDGDPRLDAVRAVALYQPRQALDFVGRQFQRGRPLYGLAEILRSVAHGGNDFQEVAKLLWSVGRTDPRELGPNPGHPMRILAELGAYDRRKRGCTDCPPPMLSLTQRC